MSATSITFPKELLYDWRGLNEQLFQKIYAIRGVTYDLWMILISRLGDYHNFVNYLIGLAVIVVLLHIVRRIRGYIGTKHFFAVWFGIFFILISGFVINGVTIDAIKDDFKYPRPYVEMDKVKPLGEVKGPADDYRSFPSGHVSFTTLMIIGLWPALIGNLRLLGLLFIGVMGWSRISLGMHFPADVVGAFLITATLIILLRVIVYWMFRKLFGLHCYAAW